MVLESLHQAYIGPVATEGQLTPGKFRQVAAIMSVAAECEQVVEQAVADAFQNCGIELLAEFAVATALQLASEEAAEWSDCGDAEEVSMLGPGTAEGKPTGKFDFEMLTRLLLSNAARLGA
mmetsp:Transcript_182804/g.579166  ORF Transcript_182804/g.579166 Transcript_182804/m.579166 type:complete len:121 (-) Transcript_182804:260-622(-)